MFKTLRCVTPAITTRRGFFTTALRCKSTPISDQLHAHPVENRFAISYVSSDDTKNSTLDRSLIIGWTTDKDALNLKTFTENTGFTQFLTEVLKKNVHKVKDSHLQALADFQKDGWLHINDERNPPTWGRINFPEDIVGSVEIKDGVIQKETYQPMPAHRIMTSNGLFKLSESLTKCVVEAAKNKVK